MYAGPEEEDPYITNWETGGQDFFKLQEEVEFMTELKQKLRRFERTSRADIWKKINAFTSGDNWYVNELKDYSRVAELYGRI